jgi:GNAT superfamily N-acetyltransferase
MMIGLPEPLGSQHDVSLFDCGKAALNDWLRSHALRNEARGFTRVLVVAEGTRVVGFYGLAPTAMQAGFVPRKVRTGLSPDPIPCVLLGQLAVDRAYAGRGIGSALLRDALDRCVRAAKMIGGRAVVVRAIDREAEVYWTSRGFESSRADGSILFRSIDDIARWLDDTA